MTFKMTDILDVNGSGTVDINSFFELFRLADMHTNYNLSASLSSTLSPVNASSSTPVLTPQSSVQSSRKTSLPPLMSPLLTPSSHLQSVSPYLSKQESMHSSQGQGIGLGQDETQTQTQTQTQTVQRFSPAVPLGENVRSRSLTNVSSNPSPKVRSASLLSPIVNIDFSSLRHVRTRSLSVQQQTVISAEGEAVFVLSRNSLDTSNHGNSRKDSLDGSNHGLSGKLNSLDYSFHGNENLPDDLPEEEEISKKSPKPTKIRKFFP